jgi:hypothetical protein
MYIAIYIRHLNEAASNSYASDFDVKRRTISTAVNEALSW